MANILFREGQYYITGTVNDPQTVCLQLFREGQTSPELLNTRAVRRPGWLAQRMGRTWGTEIRKNIAELVEGITILDQLASGA